MGLSGGVLANHRILFLLEDILRLILPIYYTQQFKRKNDKVWLVGDNAFRNWHYFLKNQVKQHYHNLVATQVTGIPLNGPYELRIRLYLKNPNSDPSNVASRMEKFTLDALQAEGVIKSDNSKYHKRTLWEFMEIDKENPRAEIELIAIPTTGENNG